MGYWEQNVQDSVRPLRLLLTVRNLKVILKLATHALSTITINFEFKILFYFFMFPAVGRTVKANQANVV